MNVALPLDLECKATAQITAKGDELATLIITQHQQIIEGIGGQILLVPSATVTLGQEQILWLRELLNSYFEEVLKIEEVHGTK